MHVQRDRQIDASEPDESGMYDYCYEYDIYCFTDGPLCLVARGYTDTTDEAHFLKIGVNGSQRAIKGADLAHPLFLLAQDHLRNEGKVHLSVLSGKGNGYEPVPPGPPPAAPVGAHQVSGHSIIPRRIPMKIVFTLLGVLLALIGVVWILQGLNVLPGSFMTGQIQWAAYGAIALLVGCVLLYAGRQVGRQPGAGR